MTESVSGVYDLIYPSPIALKKISTIAVVVELWREEICTQLESKRLQGLDLKNNVQIKHFLPSLPSTIYSLLEKYVDTFRNSILSWLKYHHNRVFNDSGSSNILSRFEDFSCDWDGTIHYARTAKRMIRCDRLTEGEKFKIACLYCLEDDIKQIWPSVSETTKKLNEIDFRTCPQQYYWICYLRNELHKIPNRHNDPIDKFMLSCIDGHIWENGNRSSIMYFWNRLPSDSLTPEDINLIFKSSAFIVARFILPKLNEHQLDIFLGAKGADLMRGLMYFRSNYVHVLQTWMYIRSRFDISNFTRLIHELLLLEGSLAMGVHFRSASVVYLFGEIWKSAPQSFKRSALDDTLHDDRLFMFRDTRLVSHYDYKGMKLLITVLQDTAFEERNAFWHKYWRKFLFSTPVEDLVVVMKLSFQNENEITLFKENFMSVYENIAEYCVSLMRHGMFKELHDALSVCCLDEQKRMELKRRLLRSNYVGENSVLTVGVFRKNKLLNEFINDAFQDAADLDVEFRNQLTSSPVTQNRLLDCIRYGYSDFLIEFVDTFFPDEQVVVPLRKRLFEHFKERLIAGDNLYIGGDQLEAFLVWLLGSEDEAIRFKQSILVEEVFRGMIRAQPMMRRVEIFRGNGLKPEFPASLENFLMWYFNKDEEEIEKFTMLFLDELKSFRPRKRRRII